MRAFSLCQTRPPRRIEHGSHVCMIQVLLNRATAPTADGGGRLSYRHVDVKRRTTQTKPAATSRVIADSRETCSYIYILRSTLGETRKRYRDKPCKGEESTR